MMMYSLITMLLHSIGVVRSLVTQDRLSAYLKSTHVIRTGTKGSRIVPLPRAVPGCGTGPQSFEADPSGPMALHVHRDRDKIIEVLDGTFRFQCDGDVFEITRGITVVVPRGVTHGWVNLGSEPARLLFSFVPGGVDDSFEAHGASLQDE
jgi:mannose-6-phosphate isomerase-like protein (cupin superfamily)